MKIEVNLLRDEFDSLEAIRTWLGPDVARGWLLRTAIANYVRELDRKLSESFDRSALRAQERAVAIDHALRRSAPKITPTLKGTE